MRLRSYREVWGVIAFSALVAAGQVFASPGDKRWEISLGECLLGAPTLSTNGDILVGTCNGSFYAVTPSGAVHWSFQTPPYGLGAPTVTDDGTIFLAADKLYALAPDGAKLWEFGGPDPDTGATYYLTDPVVGPDGAVYVARYPAGEQSRLFAVNPDGSLRWSSKGPFASPPVIGDDGTLFLPLAYGRFSAVNPDGLLRWTVAVGNSSDAPATPVAGGAALVPVSGSSGLEGAIQALSGSGSNLWRFEAGAPVRGSPVVGPDGTVYFGAGDARFVALHSDGRLAWDYTVEALPDSYPSIPSPALAADGTLYCTGQKWLHALGSGGQLLWRFDAGRVDLGPPAVGGDGTVYFSAGGTNGVLYAVAGTGAPLSAAAPWPMARRDTRHRASIAGPVVTPSAPTNLTATVDLYTDRVLLRWDSVPRATHYQILRGDQPDVSLASILAGGITGTNTFEDRTAAAGLTYQYFVRASNSAGTGPAAGPLPGRRRVPSVGEALWTLPTRASLNGSPAIGPDASVYACSSDGSLYAAGADGELKWTFGYGGRLSGSPSVDPAGTVYFSGSTNPYSGGIDRFFVWALGDSGQLKWTLALGEYSASDLAIGTNGTLYFTSVLTGSPASSRVTAVSPAGIVQWSFTNGQSFLSAPTIAFDGTIYAASREGQLVALRPDGRLLWSWFASQDPYLGAILSDGNGGLVLGSLSILTLHPDGLPGWRFPLPNGGGPWCLDSNGIVYGGSADGRLYGLFPNGTKKWEQSLPGEPRGAAVGADGNLYLTQARWTDPNGIALSVFNSSGAKLWDFPGAGVATGPPVLSHGLLCFGSTDGRVYAVKTGTDPAAAPWPQARQDTARTGRAAQPPPPPAAPSGLGATFRTRVTDVRLTWDSVLSASAYQVFRSPTTNLAEAVFLAEITGRASFDDSTATPETAFYYWVEARNATGVSPADGPVSGTRRQAVAGELLYEWDLGGVVDRSPAIGDDGTAYVSVNVPTFGSSDPGRKVAALRPDGTMAWQYWTGGALLTAPALAADGTLYVGVRGALNVAPYPSPLLALKADGSRRWELQADDAVETTPAIAADGTVYAGSASGTLYAVTPTGDLAWTLNLGGGVGSLAVGRDGTVYALLRDGNLGAVRRDGSLLWKVLAGSLPIGNTEFPGVALDEGGVLVVPCGPNGLRAFNPDGTVRWQTPAGTTFYSSPIVASNGLVILGDDQARVRCFDAAGSNVWNATLTGSQQDAAALNAAGVIHLATFDGQLRALTLAGSNAWSLSIGTVTLSPAIGPDGILYMGGSDGKVRSVYGSAPLAAAGWPMYQRDRYHTGRDAALATEPSAPANVTASDGSYNDRVRVRWTSAPGAGYYEVWRHTLNDAGAAVRLDAAVAGQVFYDDKSAVAGTNYSYWVRAGNGAGLSPLSMADSGYRRIAVPGEPIGNFHPPGPALNSPVEGPDSTIYFGSSNGRFYALWPDLTEKWEFPITSGNSGYFSTAAVAADGAIYFWASNGRFYALNPDGSVHWSLGGAYHTALPPALAPDGTIVVADADQTVFGLDTQRRLLWQYRADSAVSCPPAVGADGSVYFGTQDGQLHALDAKGSIRWRFRTGGPIESSPAVGTDGVLYFGSDDRGIYAVGPDGRLRWAALAGDQVAASPVIAPDGTVIVGSRDRRLYALRADGSRRWDYAVESAIQGSACVGSDGMIYFGTAGGRVYGLNRDGARVWMFDSATNGLSGPVLDSLLLSRDRLLVPLNSVALQALAVTAGPPEVNWPQYRHDSRRTARTKGWLDFETRPPTGLVAGESLTLAAHLALTNRLIARLELVSGTNVVATVTGTNVVTWSGLPAGWLQVSFRAVDDSGNVHSSPTVTLPVAPPPALRIAAASGGWQFDFDAVPGRRYQVERSPDLVAWSPAGAALSATGASLSWVDANPLPGAAYYRVLLLP